MKQCKSCWKTKEDGEFVGCVKQITKTCTACRTKRNAFRKDKRLGLAKCRELALVKGGKCISVKYKNARAKMQWKCAEDHEWYATPDNVKSGKWCPSCCKTTKLTIEACRELALSHGGMCLSEVYVNSQTKMDWKCAEGHEWSANFSHMRNRGQWCPSCVNKSEQLCRDIFESNLLEKFPSVRPEWLEGLELDGYNEELGIAFEYQGRQHYKYIPKFFHREGIHQFHEQQERDRRKYQICAERGVKLILIPYHVGDFRRPDDLRTFIMDQLWMIC